MQSNLLVVQNISTGKRKDTKQWWITEAFCINNISNNTLVISDIIWNNVDTKSLKYSPLFIVHALWFPWWQFLVIFLSEIFWIFLLYMDIFIYMYVIKDCWYNIHITCVVNYIRWCFFNKCVIYNVQFSDFLHYHVTLLNFT